MHFPSKHVRGIDSIRRRDSRTSRRSKVGPGHGHVDGEYPNLALNLGLRNLNPGPKFLYSPQNLH